MLGKNCARAFPTLAVAEASCDSWRLISGRCVSSSEGKPGVTRGGVIWLSEPPVTCSFSGGRDTSVASARSEEHTSELQSPDHLVCRLLLEKKKITTSGNFGKSTDAMRAAGGPPTHKRCQSRKLALIGHT